MSTLCVPRGLVKILPVVIHTEGNCLYEEPCIYYFSLQVGEVSISLLQRILEHTLDVPLTLWHCLLGLAKAPVDLKLPILQIWPQLDAKP